jgi:F-type H+-transporting ATPase subunit b
MIALFLLAAQGGDGQISQIAKTFGVDWPHLISQIVSFGIVCVVLYVFAYRRVLAMLDERRSQIAGGLANAEKIKAELDKTEAQRRDVMAKAYAEAARVVEDSRVAAARLVEHETQKAMLGAGQILLKARQAAAQEHDRMLAELKREVGRLVVLATTTVTGKILTADDQRRLAREVAKSAAA